MDDIDEHVPSESISDEDLCMQEVIRGEADLCYLHHYMTEIFRKSDS